MLDFGTIVMGNKFSELPNENRPISLDTLTLELRQLHVSRCVLIINFLTLHYLNIYFNLIKE